MDDMVYVLNIRKLNYSTVCTELYHAVIYCTKVVRIQKVPSVSGDKRYQGCQSLKGAKGARCQGTKVVKGAWVKSLNALLGCRVFLRTHFRSSLTPEEGPSCSYWIFDDFNECINLWLTICKTCSFSKNIFTGHRH